MRFLFVTLCFEPASVSQYTRPQQRRRRVDVSRHVADAVWRKNRAYAVRSERSMSGDAARCVGQAKHQVTLMLVGAVRVTPAAPRWYR
ncbi:unnamed protein product, partial [Iphiclides podalirius]